MDIIIDETLQEKYEKLKNYIKSLGSLAIAYSGGVDSTFLVKVAYDVLGDRVIAVTATSSTYPKRELNDAITFIKQVGAKHIVIESEELEIEDSIKTLLIDAITAKKSFLKRYGK